MGSSSRAPRHAPPSLHPPPGRGACPSLRAQLSRLAALSLCDLVALFAARLSLDRLADPAAPHPGPASRLRIYTQLRTFWLFLAQSLSPDRSCREAVRGAIARLSAAGAPAPSPSTSAYCQARGRLKEAWLTAISQRLTVQLLRDTPHSWLWHGHSVKLVDGSSVTMPDTPANQARWPQPGRQRRGCGFPVARIVAVFSLASGALLALAAGSLHDHERTLLRNLFDRLFQPGDVVLGDRGFCGFAEYHELARRGVHAVMRRHARLKHGAGLHTVERLGPGDLLLEWRRSKLPSAGYDPDAWRALPATMRVREITFQIEVPGFRTQTVVVLTTLTDEKAYPAGAFAALYRRRWQVELNLRDIKTTLGMDTLRCKSPEMVQKELVIYGILYNLVRGLMIDAARAGGGAPERLSFKGTVASVRQWGGAMSHARTDAERARLEAEFLRTIARDLLPVRPGRSEPRARKRRPKCYALLVKPRGECHEIPHRNRYTKTTHPTASV